MLDTGEDAVTQQCFKDECDINILLAKLIAAQVAQAESVAELNQASAMKARAEAWQTANYAGPEADARTASARSVVEELRPSSLIQLLTPNQ